MHVSYAPQYESQALSNIPQHIHILGIILLSDNNQMTVFLRYYYRKYCSCHVIVSSISWKDQEIRQCPFTIYLYDMAHQQIQCQCSINFSLSVPRHNKKIIYDVLPFFQKCGHFITLWMATTIITITKVNLKTNEIAVIAHKIKCL